MTPEREEIIKKAIVDYPWFGSHSTWTIYQEGKDPVDGVWTKGAFWLGVRTHDMVETNHDYVIRITKEEAKELLKTACAPEYPGFIWEHFIKWELSDYPLPEEKKRTYDDIDPGFWYLKYGAGYTIVEVMIGAPNTNWEGQKIVFSIDKEGCHEIEVYSVEQFIKKVPKPD